MRGTLTTYAVQIAAAIRMSFADRTNFWLQAAGMVVNNGFYILTWFLFFAGFKSIGGWRLPDFALLLGMITSVFAIVTALFGGSRDMARTILSGTPDAYLAQPKPVLARLLAQESLITGWGDGATSIVLLTVFAELHLRDLPWLLLAIATGVVTLTSAMTCFASLAFWLRGARSFARDLTDFVIMFCSYPSAVFNGWTRVMIFSVFPAGFITLTPVALLRHPDRMYVAMLLGAAGGYLVLALALFHLGLRRYRRGEAPVEG